MTTFLLLAGIASLGFSLLTFSRVRVFGWGLIPTFIVGWLRGEMALQAFVLEALFVAIMVSAGAAETGAGQVGLIGFGLSWGLLIAVHGRSLGAGGELGAALGEIDLRVEDKFSDGVSRFHGFPYPFRYGHPDVHRIRDIAYGEALEGDQGGRNLLDLVVPKAAKEGDGRPVLLQVHGGAWMIGDKREQGRPLMDKLASRGWICVAINYRLSPKATMPAHIIDVKRSIAWIRENIEGYGGNPDFLCITGGSAGGHLSSLAALTPNDPRFQPGFESVDTRVDACVPFYGVFDFLDRAGDRTMAPMGDSLAEPVFKCKPEENPELWDSVCPITHVHSDAPPFLVIQGSHDSLVFAEEANRMVGALRAKSNAPVLHAELLGAQHAFEIFHSPRTEHTVRGVVTFLEKVHEDYSATQAPTQT